MRVQLFVKPVEANTAIFWDIEDCPIPGGLDPLMFLQNIKSALNHGCRGKLSIMVYCDNNRSLDDFSLSDTSPITLVHTGEYSFNPLALLSFILFLYVSSRQVI